VKNRVSILVPTDSSTVSRAAAQYALKLAAGIRARIVMASVVEINTENNVLHNWKKLEARLMRSARKDMQMFLSELKDQVENNLITYEILNGFPKHEVICAYAQERKMDLIVMGTKGATGLWKILQGTNTAAVIGHSHIPVIAVPAKATFKPLQHIVYATDMKNLKAEVRMLATFAALFGAAILVLHIVTNDGDVRIDKNLEPQLINWTGYEKISYHVRRAATIEQGIDTFIDEKEGSMLAMFTHKTDFTERLFSRSITRKVAFQSRIPLLTFNKTRMPRKVVS